MSIDKKLSFFCLAGYATESGKQEEKIRCTAEGWSPKPRCYSKSVHGASSIITEWFLGKEYLFILNVKSDYTLYPYVTTKIPLYNAIHKIL